MKKITYHGDLILTERLREIAIGLILGDATLQTQSKYRKSYRIKFQMMADKIDFGEKIRKEFTKKWIPSAPKINKRNLFEIQTVSTQSLIPLGDLFFLTPSVDPEKEQDYGGKYAKRISYDFVQNHVTNVSLAYWFMCDGSKGDWTENEGKQIHFHTHSFSDLEVEELCRGLIEKFGLKARTTLNKKRKIVLISGDSFEDFLQLVKPEILECFSYRLPSARKGNKQVDDIV